MGRPPDTDKQPLHPQEGTRPPDTDKQALHPQEGTTAGSGPSLCLPVPVKRGFVLPGRVQRLISVHGHRRPDTLVRTLEGLVIGREDVQAAGHPAGREVRQVLAALLLMVCLPLVAVPTRVPALGAAGGERSQGGGGGMGRRRDPQTSPALTLWNLYLQALFIHRLILNGNSQPLQKDQPQSSNQLFFQKK